jgi:hypothetical protein
MKRVLELKCPYLIGTCMHSCGATEEAYVPSTFEYDEYCFSMRHKLCPFYCMRRSEEDSSGGRFPWNGPASRGGSTPCKK